MARISETEFYNDKDVITQIEWLKDHIGGARLQDVRLHQDTTIGSETYGRVTMIFVMENGETYERYFDNNAISNITSQQVGEVVNITFHLNNGQTYTVPVTIHVTATTSWAGLTGQPQDSVPLTNWMATKADTSTAALKTEVQAEALTRENADTQLNTAIGNENVRATAAETALGTRIDTIVNTLGAILYPVGSLYITTNDSDPASYLGFGNWELYSKGRTLIGRNPDDADYNTTGAVGGSKSRTLSVGQLPAHSHSIVGVGNHTHNGTTAGAGGHSHTFQGQTVSVSYIGSGGQHPIEGNTGSYGTSGVGDHSHTYTTSENGGHSHTCNNTGSGNPVDIRDPYIVVNIWKRIA